MLLLLQQIAYADLWAFVDARGVTHFAAEQLDERYALFFRGNDFDSARDMALPQPAQPGLRAPMSSASGARLLAFFEVSPGYKIARQHLRAASVRHGVDYELLQAVIATESGFDAQAVSPRGAVGLMQLMPATASRFGVAGDARLTLEQKLTDPAINVAAGTRYLRYLMDLFEGRLDLALAAYNAGEGAVQRAGNRIPAYRETRNYVQSVMGLYALLKPPAPLLEHRTSTGRTGRVRMELPAAPRPLSDAGESGVQPAPPLRLARQLLTESYQPE
ncbi:lytic transglycosylase domain-containing protein [Diaphorobacter sp.]|uniref:lytic transglycosylase domain-containing protein n=2 Tax=Diaphorobacter sp. TaxID=1934310 RepID=UPI003D0EC75B